MVRAGDYRRAVHLLDAVRAEMKRLIRRPSIGGVVAARRRQRRDPLCTVGIGETRMIDLIVSLVVLCLVLWLIIYIFQMVPFLMPLQWLAYVICAVLVVVFLIRLLESSTFHGVLLR
jgi:Ca2+/Na+ antiporter